MAKHSNVSFSQTSGTGTQNITVTVGSPTRNIPSLSTVKVTTQKNEVEKVLSIWQKGTVKLPLFFNPTTKEPKYINLYAPESSSKIEFSSYSPWRAGNTEYIDANHITSDLSIVDYFANIPVNNTYGFRYYNDKPTYLAPKNSYVPPFAIIGDRYDVNNAPVIEDSPLVKVELEPSDVKLITVNQLLGGQTLVIRETSTGEYVTENFNSSYFTKIFTTTYNSNSYSKFIVYDKLNKKVNIQRVAIQAYDNDDSFYLKIFICNTSDSNFNIGNIWDKNKEFIKLTVTNTGKVLSEKRTYNSSIQFRKELLMRLTMDRPFNITPTEELIKAENPTATYSYSFMSNLPIYYIGVEDAVAPMSMNPNIPILGSIYDVDIIQEGNDTPILSLKDIPFYSDTIIVDNMTKLSTPIPPFTLITIKIVRQENFGQSAITPGGIHYKKSIGFTATFCSSKSIHSNSPIENSDSFVRKKCVLQWSNTVNKPIIPDFPNLES